MHLPQYCPYLLLWHGQIPFAGRLGESGQLSTDKSEDLLGERRLWDKFHVVLITADNHCFWETKGLWEAFFTDIMKFMCMYLNKNNSRVSFSSPQRAQVQQESTGEYKCACIQGESLKNLLFSLEANNKVFKPSQTNKVASETAPYNASRKHTFPFKAIFSLFL